MAAALIDAMFNTPNPDDCTTMAEVREGVDEVDRQLVALLQRRFGYMDAAARIKIDRNVVRDETRMEEVQAKIRAEGERLGLPADRLRPIWNELMEQSIAYEFEMFDRLLGGTH